MNADLRTIYKKVYDQTKVALEAALELELKVSEDPQREYEFDSGDGRVLVRKWSPKQVTDLVDKYTARLDSYSRKLNGGDVVFIRMRR